MSVRLHSVGDIMLGENSHHFGRGIPRRFHGRYGDLLAPDVRAFLSDADYLIGNFECTVLPDREWAAARLEEAIYSAPESALSFLDSLRPAKVLNVANNHFLEHGLGRARATVARLRERGVTVAGETFEPAELRSGDRRLLVWGVSIAKDPHFTAGGYAWCEGKDLPGALCLPRQKRAGEVWVLSVHWGGEYRTWPGDAQRETAERLAEAGFDLVLGHHPHVIQPVMRIGNCWIAFSQGNFIFDQNFSRSTQAGLVIRATPGGIPPELHYSVARGYRVERLCPVTRDELETACRAADNPATPFRMRVRMKAELLLRGYQSNRQTLRYFLRRAAGVSATR